MYGYIYETTNLINGKKYIGQKKSEKFLAEKYLGSGKILNKAIDKYGKENFKVKLIEECKTEEELNEQEIYWIKYYKNNYKDKCYNICDGGHFRFYNTGHKLSKEHKEKIGNANRGRHHTFETKMYLSKVLKGRKLSEETKKKMSIFQKKLKRKFLSLKEKDLIIQK